MTIELPKKEKKINFEKIVEQDTSELLVPEEEFCQVTDDHGDQLDSTLNTVTEERSLFLILLKFLRVHDEDFFKKRKLGHKRAKTMIKGLQELSLIFKKENKLTLKEENQCWNQILYSLDRNPFVGNRDFTVLACKDLNNYLVWSRGSEICLIANSKTKNSQEFFPHRLYQGNLKLYLVPLCALYVEGKSPSFHFYYLQTVDALYQIKYEEIDGEDEEFNFQVKIFRCFASRERNQGWNGLIKFDSKNHSIYFLGQEGSDGKHHIKVIKISTEEGKTDQFGQEFQEI